MQVVLRSEVETEIMILGMKASAETEPEGEEEVHFARTCQNQANVSHIRYSLGASLRGAFPNALQVVYDRMLAWMVPSSTYPDGQLALVVWPAGRILLTLLFRRSRVAAHGKHSGGGSAETLQCKRQT